MVPSEFRASPPAPTDTSIRIANIPARTLFALSFPGWATERTVLDAAGALGAALEADGEPFEAGRFYTAGYDSPFRLFDRHNEVLFKQSKGHKVPLGDASAAVAAE
jgi:hypothetical protein